MGRLADRTALVTGAGSGIGRAIALAFGQEGAHVVLVDKLNLVGAEEAVAELVAMGRTAAAVSADVSEPRDVERAVARALEHLGHLDILVNNAGIGGGYTPIHEMTLDQWDRMIAVNLRSVFLFTRAVVPHMMARRYGKIINVSSQLAHKPAPNSAHYCAAKAGVVAFTASTAIELCRHGINVNTLAPGPTDTPMWNSPGGEEWRRWKLEQLPIGRVGRPEEMAAAAVFLASDEASYVVGQTLSPNGGDVMW
jgi:3-oxoacyl-[acyl-carrier protein] reductase